MGSHGGTNAVFDCKILFDGTLLLSRSTCNSFCIVLDFFHSTFTTNGMLPVDLSFYLFIFIFVKMKIS